MDRLREIRELISSDINNRDQLFAAFAYFPVIGWIYPRFRKRERPLIQFHALQAFRLNLVMFLVFASVLIFKQIPFLDVVFEDDHFFAPLISSILVFVGVAYLIFTVTGAFKAYSGELWEIPLLKQNLEKFANKFGLSDLFKSE